MAIVYMARNKTTGERYIGVTSKTLDSRRSGHECAAFTSMSKTKFAQALRQYGRRAWEWTILHKYKTREEALIGEVCAIARLAPEYNSTSGGDGVHGLQHSEETKAKLRAANTPERRARMSALMTGRKHTEDAKIKMSAAQKGKPNLKARGLKRSPEAIERMRVQGFDNIEIFKQYAALGPASMSRPVICLDTGEKFESASAAARALGVAKSALIELCQGKRTRMTVGGKRFRYADEPEFVDFWTVRRQKLTEENVRQIRALRGSLSLRELGLRFGVSRATIGDVVAGRCWKKVA